MNTEERLAKAEELLKRIASGSQQIGALLVSVEEIEQFLNPEPEIDWVNVPVGTAISHNIQVSDIFLSQRGEFISTSHGHTVTKDNCTIRPQVSHIHKCKWPSDGKKPDWVKDDDWILTEYEYHSISPDLFHSNNLKWDANKSKWFAVLKIAEYWK